MYAASLREFFTNLRTDLHKPLAGLRRCPLLPGIILIGLLLLLVSTGRPAQASPSGITYLGQLVIGGTPANGTYDFQFQLYNAATGGSQVGSTVSLTSVPVTDGVYYAFLYFGTGVITGQNLWIQVAYRVHPSSGNPPYTTLSPRNNATNSATADYAQLSGSTAALQGKPISTVVPATGQVLQWSGSLWTPTTPSSGGGGSYTAGTGLTLSGSQFSVATGGITSSLLANSSVTGSKLALPLTASVSSSSDLFTLTNSGSGRAIVGNSSGIGVYGANTSSGNGDYGLLGGTEPNSGNSLPVGVFGNDTNSGYGVYGISKSGTGVYGYSDGYGVNGYSNHSTGVYGYSTGYSSDNYGVEGTSINSSGVAGIFGAPSSLSGFSAAGVFGNSNAGTGVLGTTSASGGTGVVGASSSGTGVKGIYGAGSGLSGYSTGAVMGDTNTGTGVLGLSSASGGFGVVGASSNGTGVYGYGTSNAGYFNGNVEVTGTLTAGAKNFKIDHPLDPAHQYLSHASIESDQMLDLYSGHVTLDAAGAATVTMPSWFQALNTEFEYHLTPLGAPGPNLYIAKEIDGNQFTIAGGQPGAKVSWQVTGIRHDAFALAHPLQVEEDKPADEQGLYLHPKEFGLPESLSILHSHPGTNARPVLPLAETANAPKPPTHGTQQ